MSDSWLIYSFLERMGSESCERKAFGRQDVQQRITGVP